MPEDELNKEKNYFSIAWKKTEADYIEYYSQVSNQYDLVGDASTPYLTDPDAAERIYGCVPDALIIILLRHPADRAYSLYNWMVQAGYEYAGTFEKALLLEKKRAFKRIPNFFEPEYYWNYMYFRSGLYYGQVKRYKDLFSANVLVMKLDDFISDFDDAYKRICQFLGVAVNHVHNSPVNVSKKVYSPKFQFLLRKLNRLLIIKKRLMRQQIVSKRDRDRIMKIGFTGKKPPAMKPDTRKMLIKRYKADLLNLKELTGMDLSDWME